MSEVIGDGVSDTPQLRKDRGAFFTPMPIARFLANWAVGGRPDVHVLDPTCGDGVFLLACAELSTGHHVSGSTRAHLYGVDLHQSSLAQTEQLLRKHDSPYDLVAGDFFREATPDQLGSRLPLMDAVVGNPPFVRYQLHKGEARQRSAAAAMAQGVRLSGLASSWAALLVHSAAFLKPDGRIAMVLPAELLSVNYAEPIRRWLRQRFSSVHLVLFDNLQFADAIEGVVLLVAQGSGGCDAFTLHQVNDASDLEKLHIFDGTAVRPEVDEKWTDLLLQPTARGVFRNLLENHFSSLGDYADIELGTVTGANSFFAITEATREYYKMDTKTEVVPLLPPGSRHLAGPRYTQSDWQQQKLENARIWLVSPSNSSLSRGLAEYVRDAEAARIHEAYKCSIRSPWWKVPTSTPPDAFFTYMSNVTPRMATNEMRARCVNSVHALRHREALPREVTEALPYVAMNSASMLGAELYGRSYGGGILKMEPREAARLPLPSVELISRAWTIIREERGKLEELLRAGNWQAVRSRVDDALLVQTAELSDSHARMLQIATSDLRRRRTRREDKVRPS